MKLNHDCIRDILLYIEENTQEYYDYIEGESIVDNLKDKYTENEVAYSLRLLEEANYIRKLICADVMNVPLRVSSLTWNGHEYLDNVRDKSAWEKLKQSGLASMSLDVAKDLAKEIVMSLAKQKLHLE